MSNKTYNVSLAIEREYEVIKILNEEYTMVKEIKFTLKKGNHVPVEPEKEE